MSPWRCYWLVHAYLAWCHVTGHLLSNTHLVDMTHTFNKDVPYWKGAGTFDHTIDIRGMVNEWWYESNNYAGPEHGGTHIDAPSHFAKGKQRLHEIPLGRLIGHGVRMDFCRQAAADRDYQITAEDLQQWETVHGPLPPRTILLLDTGWTHKWPDKRAVYGTDTLDVVESYHFPGLHPDAAEWLVTERPQVTAVGIDTPSIDFGQTKNFLSHRRLLWKEVSAFENVANMHLVPVVNSTVFAIPMKIGEGSGGPLRIFAAIPTPSHHQHDTPSPLTRRLVEITLLACVIVIIYVFLC